MVMIRADGNAGIGAGHLMRCLTIAQALADKLKGREEICFLCADEQSADMVRAAGFAVRVLHTDYQDMESELPRWETALMERKAGRGSSVLPAAVILVDSYYVTDAYLEGLRSYGKVYLMDDMQERVYPVDVVINYNAFAKEELYCRLYGRQDTECLVGSSYVPIRQQFLHRHYQVACKVKNVLITTGGGDVDNIAGKILQAVYEEDLEFHIVTGRFNPHLETLQRVASRLRGIHIYHDVSDMAGLMEQCDIAVTAGGTTVYELAAIGVPFLCFSYAANQEALTEYIGKKGIAGYAGAFHLNENGMMEGLKALFDRFCADADLRKECSRKEQNMIDGKGAYRLAEKMILGRNDRKE